MMEDNNMSSQELLEQIFHYMNCLVEEKDFHKSLLLLTELGKVMVDSERASFWYIDEKADMYKTLVALDADPLEVPRGRGVVGVSIEENTPVISNEPYLDERFFAETDWVTGYTTHSILCVPVINDDGRVIGAYEAINKNGNDGKFDENDINRLALAAAYCGKTLEAQLLMEENVIDPLTGLKNRKGFYDAHDDMKESEASIILCDIDFFKKVNDTYGHNVGDLVLVHIADLMQKAIHEHLGDNIQVFRWGGEEFIILMPGASIEKAADFAEKLRKKVQYTDCYIENNMINLTMSFGVSSAKADSILADDIKEADDYLYAAKKRGRNKVVCSVD